MKPRPHAAEEGPLSWIERWAPADAELWRRWRGSLTSDQRAGALLPLQAALSGLIAFRRVENHPSPSRVADFRPHSYAVRATCEWALALAGELSVDREQERPWRPAGWPLHEPETSLQSLRRSLAHAVQVMERLVDLPLVDAGTFEASFDLFVRDLGRNGFFRPPGALEFSNVDELISADHFPSELTSWANDAAKTTTIVAFLALLRDHRYLGIADGLIGGKDGLYRAHVVIAGVRQELRTLARFLLVQGVETLAVEPEAVESLAMEIHETMRGRLDDALPGLGESTGLALPSERVRNGIREVRRTVKESAKRLRGMAGPASGDRDARRSERVQKNLQRDVWGFRFIVRAFVDKALVAPLGADDGNPAEDLAFAAEFVRHFRVFGPRLAKGTGYERRGPLTRAVTALSPREAVDAAKLGVAAHECEMFLQHLDAALDATPHSLMAPFDKREAAEELRGYLAAARDRIKRMPRGCAR
jgi:hypothetical protein